MDFSQIPEQKGMKLGFQNPDSGTYIWEIQDGIDVYEQEDSGPGRSFMIKMKADEILDGGSEESIGRQASYFVTMISKEGKKVDFGEKQIANLLHCTDMLDKFAAKFPGTIDLLDPKVVGALQLRLPGKFVKGEVKTNKKGYCNFETIEPVGGGSSAGSKGGGTSTTPAEENQDW